MPLRGRTGGITRTRTCCPGIGAVHLQRLNEPQLLKLYGTLLAEGRIKRDGNSAMFAYPSDRTAQGASHCLASPP